MTVAFSPFLRNAIALDAVVTGAAALLMMSGASLLSPWLGLPAGLLFWAGAALVPFVGLLAWIVRRGSVSRLILIDVVAINALWVAGSVLLLVGGFVEPTILGYAFVLAQALAVAFFAELQFVGLRRSASAA